MNIEEQIKEILGYDEYEPSGLWVYLVETGRTDIVRELTDLLTKQDVPISDKPCESHRLAFSKECPESANITNLARCPICGFLVK